MRRIAEQVMAIDDVTLGDAANPIRIRGHLTLDSEKAFAQIRPQFEALGHTPLMRREEDQDVLRAMPVVFGKEKSGIPWLAIGLLIATIISVFYIGMGQNDHLFVDPLTALVVQITGNTSMIPYDDLIPTPEVFYAALWTGFLYMLALLGILGAHEMGHYIVARYHKVHTTLPFFIPMPFSILGTLGAVIAMREPAPNRKVQFDIGIAGPLAGLAVAVPVIILGLLNSEVATRAMMLARMPASIRAQAGFIQEGNSLLYAGLKFLIFGKFLPSGDLDVWVHPIAFAGWAGFLVTALNLLPIGQLDGGHVVYGLLGERARLLRNPILAVLVIMAVAGTLAEMKIIDLGFGWSGWWIWIIMITLMLRSHAPVLDEITGLDDRRKLLGWLMLAIFILTFTPTPLVITGGGG
jgi:membrane-associated protease RseP (regulator of RpoE activity)